MKKTIVQKKNRLLAKRTISMIKVLEFLAGCPNDSFSLTEIAKKAGISKAAASAIVKDLAQKGWVVIGQIANLWRVQYNIGNLAARGFKISHNLYKVYQSGIIDYLIQKWGAPRAIILFGSVRNGEDSPGSDIDIAIEIEGKKSIELCGIQGSDEQAIAVQEFEKSMSRKFRLCFYSRENIDPNLYANIANGIVLYGFLEVVPWTKKASEN